MSNDNVIDRYIKAYPSPSPKINGEVIDPADLGYMEQADIDNLLRPNQEVLETVIGGPNSTIAKPEEKKYSFVLVKNNGETVMLKDKTYQQMYECVRKLYVAVNVYQKVQEITPRTEIDIKHIY